MKLYELYHISVKTKLRVGIRREFFNFAIFRIFSAGNCNILVWILGLRYILLVFILKHFSRQIQIGISYLSMIKIEKARPGLKFSLFAILNNFLGKNGAMFPWSKKSEKKSVSSLGQWSLPKYFLLLNFKKTLF